MKNHAQRFNRLLGSKRTDKEVKNEQELLSQIKGRGKLSAGEITRRILKKKKIYSPSISGKIKIKPGLWIVPKKELKTQKQIDAYVEKFKLNYGIDE